MYLDFKDYKELTRLADDLYWDEQRMSTSGVETLNKIDVVLTRIENNQNG